MTDSAAHNEEFGDNTAQADWAETDMTDSAAHNEEFGGYAASVAELDAILTSLDDDSVDIDTLASQVERASLLIAHCEQRLRATELSLQSVLARHEPAPADSDEA